VHCMAVPADPVLDLLVQVLKTWLGAHIVWELGVSLMLRIGATDGFSTC